MTTDSATMAIATATMSSAVAHLGSFTLAIVSAFAKASADSPYRASERAIFDADARAHQHAEARTCASTPVIGAADDHRHADQFADHREVVGMRR